MVRKKKRKLRGIYWRVEAENRLGICRVIDARERRKVGSRQSLGLPAYRAGEWERKSWRRTRREVSTQRGFSGENGALTPLLRHILRPVVPQLQLRRMRAQPPPCRSLQLRSWPAVSSTGVSSATVTLRLLLPRPETTTMTRHARLKQARRQTERISARNDILTTRSFLEALVYSHTEIPSRAESIGSFKRALSAQIATRGRGLRGEST